MTDCIYHDEGWGFCFRIRDWRQMCEYEPRCEECPYRKPVTKKNNCAHHTKGKCKLTAHDHDDKQIIYVCAYPDNCEKCKDYKPKKKD